MGVWIIFLCHTWLIRKCLRKSNGDFDFINEVKKPVYEDKINQIIGFCLQKGQ